MATTRSKYSLLGRINWEDLYNAFLGLEEKKQLLIVVSAAIFIILLLVLPVTCASSRLGDLEKEYEAGKKGSLTFTEKITAYQNDKALLSSLQKQISQASQGGSMSAIIESMANEAGINENIERLKPVNLATTDYYDEEGVDAVISRVTLPQIIDFLYSLESRKDLALRIRKLQLKPRYGSRSQITATFQITSVKLKGDENE